jgi:hypothetical protein
VKSECGLLARDQPFGHFLIGDVSGLSSGAHEVALGPALDISPARYKIAVHGFFEQSVH